MKHKELKSVRRRKPRGRTRFSNPALGDLIAIEGKRKPKGRKETIECPWWAIPSSATWSSYIVTDISSPSSHRERLETTHVLLVSFGRQCDEDGGTKRRYTCWSARTRAISRARCLELSWTADSADTIAGCFNAINVHDNLNYPRVIFTFAHNDRCLSFNSDHLNTSRCADFLGWKWDSSISTYTLLTILWKDI